MSDYEEMDTQNNPTANKERGKTPAFTAYEKALLEELVDDDKDNIENTKTDYGSIHRKQKAWSNLEANFNADPKTVKRTQEQLKKAWDNRKQKAKKAKAAHNKSIRRTGGGPPDTPLPPDVERICKMIPNQLNSLRNPFDCDGEFELDSSEPFVITSSEKENENITDKNSEVIFLPTTKVDATAKSHASTKTKECQQNAGSTTTPGPKQQKKDPRSMLVELEGKEHDERMKNLRKQGQILDCELQIKKRKREMMEEEHALQIEILKQKIHRTKADESVCSSSDEY
ncbi:unnamed protein product [Orchesella dallaii]|uniref:Regulatory protein zeste n=1 Tax=Orchesella dallaii TaxID=48710 RepID=A0ABP1QIK9_9HEXA